MVDDDKISETATTDDEASEKVRYQEEVQKPDYVLHLKQAGEQYASDERFSVGDVVEWKPNMKSAPMPSYSAPAVVVDMLDDRVDVMQSTLFPTAYVVRYNMHIGVIDGDGDFVVLKADSARFQKWQS